MKDLIETVNSIDNIIRKQSWFDFHIYSYDSKRLIIAGGTDLTYYHELEIIFEDVFFVSGYFQGWHSNTNNMVFLMPDDEFLRQLNIEYEIEQRYQLFIFKTEDYSKDVIIASKSLTFNQDIVYYYNRADLKENERIAPFVNKEKAG